MSDHQMVIDSDAQIIYVFGGRVIEKHSDIIKYSGFYSYNIRLSKWRTIPAYVYFLDILYFHVAHEQ